MSLLALIPSLGPMELVIILLIVIILFGSSRLSQIGKGLGEGIRNFKKGVKDDDSQERSRERIDKGEPNHRHNES